MGWLRLIWRALRLSLHLGLGITLTLLICRRDRRTGTYRHNPYVVSWWNDRLLHILQVEVEVVGHRPQAPALLVANHVSWLDVPVIASLAHTSFLSKDEIRAWPVVGWLAATAGTLFIQRGGGQAGAITQAISQRLAADGLVTLFPEGTTTDGSDVRPFFSRLFGSAIDTHTRVIPVGLHYHVAGRLDPLAPFIGDQTLVHNLLGILKRRRSQVRVTFGTAIDTAGMDRKGAAETARHAIRAAIGATPPAQSDTAAAPAAQRLSS